MRENFPLYVNGAWVASSGNTVLDVVNPANESIIGRLAVATEEDVERAVLAARNAFDDYSHTPREYRIAILDRVIASYTRRMSDLARAVTAEMGAPVWLAEQMQVVSGLAHLKTARDVLARYDFSAKSGGTTVVREPVGVCALITPWNWPLNQIACKVAPALAVGCTMVLKPSEAAPFSASIFAEIMDDARIPAGVFNLVHGDGSAVGAALSAHAEVDMVSFTGSTRAGIEVARNAAPTIKRVHQELGGKSPNIILPDADFEVSVLQGVQNMMLNSGQSCNAPSRMLISQERMQDAIRVAKRSAEEITVGDPGSGARMGPVVSRLQWEKIQVLIAKGIAEGATLIAGGPGRPEGLDCGFYVRPTVFANVTNDMTIAREEIFGPVLTILGYQDEAQAIAIANDTPFGLAAYIQGRGETAHRVASRLRAGQIIMNGASLDFNAPFGGYKQSGNGREWGEHAFAEFLETKAIVEEPTVVEE